MLDQPRGTTVRSLTADLAAVIADRDSLRQVIEATPYGGECRVLGIPCPVIVGGYGATLSDGLVRTGPVVAVGWRIAL